MNETALLAQLAQPFAPDMITWKPGSTTKDGKKCMALTYADLRAYQERLDEVCGLNWSVSYEPWGENRIIARLTIHGVTRSSTGEYGTQDEKNGIAGTVAEAQALKRAAAMFGMGRYLYDYPSGWVEFDASVRRITDAAQRKLLAEYTAWYKREIAQSPQPPTGRTEDVSTPDGKGQGQKSPQGDAVPASGGDDDLDKLHRQLHALGKELYNGKWDEVRARNVQRVSNGRAESSKDLTPDEVQALINGMNQLKAQRQAA